MILPRPLDRKHDLASDAGLDEGAHDRANQRRGRGSDAGHQARGQNSRMFAGANKPLCEPIDPGLHIVLREPGLVRHE
jgi:hypothetical protein